SSLSGFERIARGGSCQIRGGIGRDSSFGVQLPYAIGGLLSGDEGMVGVVVFPLAVTAGEQDVALAEPFTQTRHGRSPAVIVDHIRIGQIALRRREDRIVGAEDAYLATVIDAAADEVVAFARQGLVRRVSDLAGQAEAARRIAVRAGIALHEDAVE